MLFMIIIKFVFIYLIPLKTFESLVCSDRYNTLYDGDIYRDYIARIAKYFRKYSERNKK